MSEKAAVARQVVLGIVSSCSIGVGQGAQNIDAPVAGQPMA
jgi:hypothetical protein